MLYLLHQNASQILGLIDSWSGELTRSKYPPLPLPTLVTFVSKHLLETRSERITTCGIFLHQEMLFGNKS